MKDFLKITLGATLLVIFICTFIMATFASFAIGSRIFDYLR